MSPEALAQARARLEALRALENPLEVQLRAAAVLSRVLGDLGEPVVVGGSAVSFYTGGAYFSRDADLIVEAEPRILCERLGAVGFERRGSAWVHREVDLVVDFPAPPLLAGDRSRLTHVHTEDGPVALIGLEDLLVDRLNAAVHWNDAEAREWCVTMLAVHPDLDVGYLERRATQEGLAEALAQAQREAEALRREAGRSPF